MAGELGKREVAAPVKDWLSKGEVCGLLEVSEGTLEGMIDRGEFPRPVPFRGENRARWRWVDVCWYLLGREIADRLSAGDEAADPRPAPKRG